MRTVIGVQFSQDEIEVFTRALPGGFDEILGRNDKERLIVRKWRHRLTEASSLLDELGERQTETFFDDDLVEAIDTLKGVADYLEPQTEVSWWREQYEGIPGSEGFAHLALERSNQIIALGDAMSILISGRDHIREAVQL